MIHRAKRSCLLICYLYLAQLNHFGKKKFKDANTGSAVGSEHLLVKKVRITPLIIVIDSVYAPVPVQVHQGPARCGSGSSRAQVGFGPVLVAPGVASWGGALHQPSLPCPEQLGLSTRGNCLEVLSWREGEACSRGHPQNLNFLEMQGS